MASLVFNHTTFGGRAGGSALNELMDQYGVGGSYGSGASNAIDYETNADGTFAMDSTITAAPESFDPYNGAQFDTRGETNNYRASPASAPSYSGGGPAAPGANNPRADETDRLRYRNQGATRNQRISQQLADSMSFLDDMDITMEVFSGGQHSHGTQRVGSHRHDHGGAADVFYYRDGRRLDWARPEDRPIFQEIITRAAARGVTGIGVGPGYMQQGSMHVGFGTPAVWGAEGRSANAPAWARAAYERGRAQYAQRQRG